MENWRTQTNLLNAMFGALLFVSPWLLGFSGEAAGWNAWISTKGCVFLSTWTSVVSAVYPVRWLSGLNMRDPFFRFEV